MKLANSLFVMAFLLLTAAVSTSAHAARNAPIIEPTNSVPNIGSKPLSLQEVKKGIMKSALARGWQVTNDNPGKMRLRLDDRRGKYTLVIDVLYNAKEYTIKYVSSDGLRYNEAEKTIHSSYTRWINMLVKTINTNLVSASD